MRVAHRELSFPGPKGENQDCLLAPFEFEGDWWAAIADGMGGSKGGAIASRIGVSAVSVAVTELGYREMPQIFSNVTDRLLEAAREDAELSRMGTTLSVLRIAASRAFVGHVGDTRISHLRGQGVRARTHDQTEVQKLLDEGVITKAQAARYPRRNVLLSVMGPDRNFDLVQSDFEIEEGDRILLTSDGFHGKIMRREMAKISSSCASFEAFFEILNEKILSLSPEDDFTCLAIQVG